jgi:chromosome segregation ATPase
MKPIELLFFFSLLSSFLIVGCASDPAKGGFFDGLYGMSSGKYDERQKEKQDELDKIEKNNVELDEQNIALKEKQQELEQLRQTYSADLKKLEKDLNQMENNLTRTQVEGESGLKQKRKLEQKLANLKKKVEREKKFADSSSEVQMRRELEQLKKDKKRLQEQIQDLQSM